MPQTDTTAARLNITLPKSTVELIDKVWPREQFKSRSAFLDEAARKYTQELQKNKLRKTLKAGYLARVEKNLELVREWEAIDLPWD